MNIAFDIDEELDSIVIKKHNDTGNILDYSIVIFDGLLKHVNSFSKENAQTMERQTMKLIDFFDEQRNPQMSFSQIEKLDYLLNTLIKLNTELHLISTKGVKVEKTPDYIKQGLSKLSNEAVAISLSKEK